MSTLNIINPNDRDWTRHRYILAFGAIGTTHCLVYANSIDDALDEAIDWLADNAPGHLADDQVAEAYNEAIAEGLSEEQADDRAYVDITVGGNDGHAILSWEWFILAEDPSRSEILAYTERKVA